MRRRAVVAGELALGRSRRRGVWPSPLAAAAKWLQETPTNSYSRGHFYQNFQQELRGHGTWGVVASCFGAGHPKAKLQRSIDWCEETGGEIFDYHDEKLGSVSQKQRARSNEKCMSQTAACNIEKDEPEKFRVQITTYNAPTYQTHTVDDDMGAS